MREVAELSRLAHPANNRIGISKITGFDIRSGPGVILLCYVLPTSTASNGYTKMASKYSDTRISFPARNNRPSADRAARSPDER